METFEFSEGFDQIVEALAQAVESGSMAVKYNASYGHCGPSGVVGDSDPAPCEPTMLADLEPDESAVGDGWE